MGAVLKKEKGGVTGEFDLLEPVKKGGVGKTEVKNGCGMKRRNLNEK